ncbi:bacteriophage abortive infection AbiH family protein [Bacillus cereus]|uniref:bacteriophage abortive infection AbiH family protein n=1 Tax=Bacillus cereus TaxID=1396 RepID=UPI003CFF42AE
MSKLFILGNGFDIAHKLPTKYQDFHQYLLETYPRPRYTDSLATCNIKSKTTPDGRKIVDEIEAAYFMREMISEVEGDNWSNVEASLGYLALGDYVNGLLAHYEPDDIKGAEKYEEVSDSLELVMWEFKNILHNWISSIEIPLGRLISEFKQLIDKENDLFLSFNYTRVLEEIYKVVDVYHIHGSLYSSQFADIEFGHGNFRVDFVSAYDRPEDGLAEIHNILLKDTERIIEDSQPFFDKLSTIKEIYSFGFSFSEVDLPYIEEICKKCNTEDCIWYLHVHGTEREKEQKREHQKSVISNCGFKGDFEPLDINLSVL